MRYFIFIFFMSVQTLFSQENPNAYLIKTSMKIKALEELKKQYHIQTQGTIDGYRIKICFTSNRIAAKTIKTQFDELYSNVPSYEEYLQPNFVVSVGNFKTRIEAINFFKKIVPNFPKSFLIKSKIETK